MYPADFISYKSLNFMHITINKDIKKWATIVQNSMAIVHLVGSQIFSAYSKQTTTNFLWSRSTASISAPSLTLSIQNHNVGPVFCNIGA